MKVAILSDVHGFSLALDRVLEDVAREPDIDQIVVAGDLCVAGPDPAGALERLRASGAVLLKGNTDRDLAAKSRERADFGFSAKQLGKENLQFLDSLPFSHRVSPPGATLAGEDLLVVHANPFDMDRAIQPFISRKAVAELIGDTESAVLAFGHVHISYVRQLDSMTLFNVSAVGNPKDGELKSRWGLATWESGSWSVEHRYVEYPLEETISQFRSSGFPKPEKGIEKLLHASYYD